ncbi:MAG: glycosyltransferase family 2 protein, partial [Chloroflexi bacterium]
MSKSKRDVLVSVVVPTYKRPDMLIRCLAALMAQGYDAQAYEIIIADDAACAETRQVVESWTQ